MLLGNSNQRTTHAHCETDVSCASINRVIDAGQYDDITIEGAGQCIEAGTVFSYLRDELKEDLDLSMFDAATKDQFLEERRGLLNAVDAVRKFGVRRSGLCLLMA